MPNNPIITLATDFGYRDPLAAVMKGIILGINPSAIIIDITHGIEKYNVREAALAIGMSYDQFPPGTIHVVVTDPGVGSERRPILTAAENYYFVGPDNGVFSIIYNENKNCEVFHLKAEHYFLRDRGATFHGRDIFAPVAAWLSKGVVAANFGERIADYVKLPFPVPSMPDETKLAGEIIHLDHFGNAITNITEKELNVLLKGGSKSAARFIFKGKELPLRAYYAQAPDKVPSVIINSMGRLEVFVNKGDAASELSIKIGDKIGVMLVTAS